MLHYLTNEDKVYVVGNFTHYVKPTQKVINSDWLIEFTLSNDKIVAYKILEDSYSLYLSFLTDSHSVE